MSAMQVFHDRLFFSTESQTHYLCALLQLARASLAQITSIKNLLYWDVWHTETT
jgi:hypothetical protein